MKGDGIIEMRKKLTSVLALLALLSVPFLTGCPKGNQSQGMAGNTEKLTIERATTALTAISPDLEVVSVGDSPVVGLNEVVIKDRGRKTVIYMDNNAKHLFSGKLINLETKKDVVQERMTDLNRVDIAKVDLEGTVRVGDPDAQYKIIVFDDPD
jgi:hypothetical protein